MPQVSRCLALIRKESLQVVRDPSALLIAFILPLLLLLLFAFAVSLDIDEVDIGIVLESDAPEARELMSFFNGTRYFRLTPLRTRRSVDRMLVSGELKGAVVIPQDFAQRLRRGTMPLVQVITDASQPNTANFVAGYAQGATQQWLAMAGGLNATPVRLEPRFWYNAEIDSRDFLVPGAIAIIMTMIGTLLTALVVAREWERGTMEALLSTPARVNEILLGKLLPYFCLGLLATVFSTLFALLLFDLPLRGSWFALLSMSAIFMLPALGQGLVISVLAKNQFIASQLALLSGFLPAFLLSGFLFEIDSMPPVIQLITFVVPAKYYIASLQTVFLVGDVWSVLLPNLLALLLLGTLLFSIARMKSSRSLEA